MNDTLKKVVSIIEDITDIPNDEIEENSSFIEDLDLSSLEIMSVVSSIEKAFSIKISEKEMMSIETVGDLLKLIESK